LFLKETSFLEGYAKAVEISLNLVSPTAAQNFAGKFFGNLREKLGAFAESTSFHAFRVFTNSGLENSYSTQMAFINICLVIEAIFNSYEHHSIPIIPLPDEFIGMLLDVYCEKPEDFPTSTYHYKEMSCYSN
jgi:hypothetical protein